MSLSKSEICGQHKLTSRDTKNGSLNKIQDEGEVNHRNVLDLNDKMEKSSGDVPISDPSSDEDTNTEGGPTEEENFGTFVSHVPGTILHECMT